MSLPRLTAVPGWRSGLLALCVIAGVGTGAAQAGPVDLVPHRAVYDLSLDRERSDGSITQARGKLEFEWADVCSGWTVSQRTRVELVSAEGRVVDFGWTLNALEDKNGRDYRFFIRRINSDSPTEELRGEAHLNGPGQGGVAVYSEPEQREVALPAGTMFPTAHSLMLMEAAESGAMPVWRVVFDGSGEGGLFGINAALSKSLPQNAQVHLDSPVLRGQRSWRLHLAYFSMDETEAAPEHEQALRLFANGVVDEMKLDYGEFTLRADLEELQALPAPRC